MTTLLQCVYWNRGHLVNENQSEGRTETIDSNIFKASQSNAQYKTMKPQRVRWPVMFTRRCQAQKPVVLSCAYGFRKNYMLHSVYFRSLVDLENKSCVRVLLENIYRQSAWFRVWIFSFKKPFKCLVEIVRVKLLTNHLKDFFRPLR